MHLVRVALLVIATSLIVTSSGGVSTCSASPESGNTPDETSVAIASAAQRLVGNYWLPEASVEIEPNEAPVTSTPWQLPQPGDTLYNAEQEALIKQSRQPGFCELSMFVHVFERGVFKCYARIEKASSDDVCDE